MAAAIVRHAGARHVVITDKNKYRLDLATKMGASIAINTDEINLKDVMDELGMKEGFDIGLEISGSPFAFKDMLGSMNNGGQIAMLGIMEDNAKIEWTQVIFKMITISGI